MEKQTIVFELRLRKGIILTAEVQKKLSFFFGTFLLSLSNDPDFNLVALTHQYVTNSTAIGTNCFT